MMVRWSRYISVALVALLGLAMAENTSAQHPTNPYQYRQPNQRIHQQRGATFGGLAGAVAGGLIGDNNGEAGAGAAIGGVIGAVTGGILGNAADKEAANLQEQRLYAAARQQASIQREAVSIHDVIQMSRSGIGENVIITQIQSRGVISQPQVADIIFMHQQGVSEPIITAMQQAPTRQQITTRPMAPPVPSQTVTPIIIKEHHVVPAYPPPRVYHHYPHRRYRGTGFHFRYDL